VSITGERPVPMLYIKVKWKHEHRDEPVLLYSELDDARWEVRKVEAFRDGTLGYASIFEEQKGTFLGLVEVPSFAEIESDPEFEPTEIAKEEFEEVWRRAIQKQA
jgi:hypothetical protein